MTAALTAVLFLAWLLALKGWRSIEDFAALMVLPFVFLGCWKLAEILGEIAQ